MHQIALPALEAVVSLTPCEVPPPVPVVTTVAPVREQQSLYLAAGGCLYAVNAKDGTARWCQQVKLARTREVRYPPVVSVPPPPRMSFATPRVVDGVSGVDGRVFVCMNGFVSYSCAFAADDGALRWWTPTDAEVASMPFMDWAVPLVTDGIVYSGTYALNAQDGTVLWRIAIDTLEEGTLALHALADETLYASTTRGLYAINTQNGQIRWRYEPEEPSHVSGPPVVADGMLYAGTNAFVGYPLKGYVFALDVESGTEVWRYPMGDYIGAVVQHETIYVSSGDQFLYALDAKSGALRWRRPFAALGHYPATIAHDVLFIATDGAYALRSADGAVLWHQPLGSSPSVSFRQPVVLDGAVYLVRLDKRGRGVLYALKTRTGAEYWHTPYPSALSLALAQ
jgi:outer membrane protein assembly factor BamB